MKYLKTFESLLYKPDGGPEKYLFVYGDKKDNRMVAHTGWEYKKKPVTKNMLSTLENNLVSKGYNSDILRKIMNANEIEYLEDQHSILPMFRLKENGRTLYNGDDGITMIDGWISNKLFGTMNLRDCDFQDMKRYISVGFINEDELDKFIEHNEIGDKYGFKKVLRTIGFNILENCDERGIEFVHDPNG